MIWWIVGIIAYLICAFVAYSAYIKNWDNTEAEKQFYSFIWILMIPLYGIHYLYNKD